jgi:transposase
MDTISPGILRQIVETAIQYCIEFDLLVPPYEQIKIATVDQMNQKMSHSKMVTAKRLGFGFKTDDV